MAITLGEKRRIAERLGRLLFVDDNKPAVLDADEMREIIRIVDEWIDENGPALLASVRATVGSKVTQAQLKLALLVLLTKDYDGKVV
jgi:hypothetical protein